MAKTKHPPTIWEALNEPVMEISEDQAKNIVLASVVIIAAAWVAPYWGAANEVGYSASANYGAAFEEVAGATIASKIPPDWYYVIAGIPAEVSESFAVGASEVLDISGSVSGLVGFYEPGTSAVLSAWLDLMADPEI